MGIVVRCEGQEIWSPSLRVGNLFFDEIKALECALDQKSGIESFLADTLDIDAPVLGAFIESALRTLDMTNNGPLLALFSGCLQVAIALNVRITKRWPVVSDRLRSLIGQAETVMNPLSDKL
jgi:hypothetical protein